MAFDFSTTVLQFLWPGESVLSPGQRDWSEWGISGTVKFRFGFFALLLCLLAVEAHCVPCKSGSSSSRAGMEPAPEEGRFGQVTWQTLYCTAYGIFHWFLQHPFALHTTQHTGTGRVSLRLPLVCLVRPVLGFCLRLCGANEEVIQVSQILHPSLEASSLFRSDFLTPSRTQSAFKVVFCFAPFVQSQNSWGWKGLLEC